MSVNFLRRVVGGKGESIESIVDASSIERGVAFGCGGFGVELGEVEASGFFDGGLCVFGGGAGVFLFFC